MSSSNVETFAFWQSYRLQGPVSWAAGKKTAQNRARLKQMASDSSASLRAARCSKRLSIYILSMGNSL